MSAPRRLSQLSLVLVLAAAELYGQAYKVEHDQMQDDISALLDKAVSSKDPEEQIQLYRKILQLDPYNTNAFNGVKQAQQALEEQEKERADRAAAAAKQTSEARTKQAEQSQAAADTDRAAMAGDLASARKSLERLKQAGGSAAQVQQSSALVNQLASYKQKVQMAVAALGAVGLAAILGLLWMGIRKKTPFLEVLDGPSKGTRFLLEKDVTLLGAVSEYGSGKNDIVLVDEDRLISRSHCEFHKQAGRVYVIDCNSSNGTFLNQSRLAPESAIPIRGGARIGLGGSCELRLGFQRSKT